MSDAAALLVVAALLLGGVGVGEGLRAWAGWRPESTRRAVHAGVGLVTAASLSVFSGPVPVYVLGSLFVGANALALRRRWLPGMHAIQRRSVGTVTFPLALLVATALCWSFGDGQVYVVQTALVVLALADPAAALVGTRVRRPGPYRIAGEAKSLAGSAAFAVVASLSTVLMLTWLGPRSVGPGQVAAGALVVALVGGAAEALGRRGWDNLWIVLAVVVPLAGLDRQPDAAGLYVLALLFGVVFGFGTYRLRFLDLSGALSGAILGWMLIALGGLAWAVPALVFFVFSSLLSRAGRQRKAAAEARSEKGSRRDAGQVAANGGVAAAFLALSVFVPSPAFYWGFVGSFAAAAADTWGTETGTMVGGRTRLLGVGPRVAPGTSGGVSLAGTLGTVLGASVVVASALLVVEPGAAVVDGPWLNLPGLAAVVVSAGVLGAFVDTALGATVQARYRRPDGDLTERSHAEGRVLPLAAGVRWVDNDRVNAVGTLVGGLIPLLLFL